MTVLRREGKRKGPPSAEKGQKPRKEKKRRRFYTGGRKKGERLSMSTHAKKAVYPFVSC